MIKARLSVLVLALLMGTAPKHVYSIAQANGNDRRYEVKETALQTKQPQRASSSFFGLSNLFPSFMKPEHLPPASIKVRSKKRSFTDTPPPGSTSRLGLDEPLPSGLVKTRKKTAPKVDLSIEQTILSSSTSAPSLHVSKEGSQGGYFGDVYPTPSRYFEQRRMNVPARGRIVLFENSSPADEKQPSQEPHAVKPPVPLKIKEYAEKSSSLSTREGAVRIGDADIPRRKVSAVGDVDGNQITDYIVSNIAAKNYSGTVRLYLMGHENSFLYTRDLVPGKWGFQHPELSVGDRYGTTVFRLPNAGNSSQCFIAITAPGDRTTKDSNGAVYILELSEKGNVNNHTKLSATEFLELVEEQKKEEETTKMRLEKPSQTSSSSSTSRLKHLDGVTSMLFLNASGGVQAVLNVKVTEDNDLDLLRHIDRHLLGEKAGKTTPSPRMNHFSSRVVRDGACLFTKTECYCELDDFGGKQEECFELFQSQEKREKVICLRKPCPAAYKCSCGGKEKCRRVEKMEDVYVAQSTGDRGELYCTSERRLVSKTIPVTET